MHFYTNVVGTLHPVMSVALAAGFVSASHFSKAYKNLFGYPPREERRPELVHQDRVDYG